MMATPRRCIVVFNVLHWDWGGHRRKAKVATQPHVLFLAPRAKRGKAEQTGRGAEWREQTDRVGESGRGRSVTLIFRVCNFILCDSRDR